MVRVVESNEKGKILRNTYIELNRCLGSRIKAQGHN